MTYARRFRVDEGARESRAQRNGRAGNATYWVPVLWGAAQSAETGAGCCVRFIVGELLRPKAIRQLPVPIRTSNDLREGLGHVVRGVPSSHVEN